MKYIYNKLIKKSLLIIGVLFVLAGCTDEFLTQKNPNGGAFEFENLDDTTLVLNSLYNNLLNHFVLNISFDALVSDLAIPFRARLPTSVNRPRLGSVRLNNLELRDNLNEINQKWAAMYRGIFIANQLIFGLEQIEKSLTSDEQRNGWTSQMAQARFFRGMYHFYLHSTFNKGEIVIKDKYNTSALESSTKLSSSKDVITFFVKDLEYALDNLIISDDLDASQNGRVTKGAAAMLLANHYLYQREYDQAIELYQKIILKEYGDYSLAPADLMFTTAGEYNSESIFEINYTIDINFEQIEFDETSFHNRLAFDSSFFSAQTQFLPASWLIELYQNEKANKIDDGKGGKRDRTVSKRASAMIALVKDEEPTKFYGFTSVHQRANSFAKNRNRLFANIAMFKKYTNHDTRGSDGEKDVALQANRRSGKNVTVLRLAEAYLNLAECFIEKNQLQEAINQINVVRRRWDLVELDINSSLIDGTPYNQESLREHFRNVEKPLELSIEGHSTRIIDLRRWGIGSERYDFLSGEFHTLIDHESVLNDDREDMKAVTTQKSLIQKGIIISFDDDGNLIRDENAHSEFRNSRGNYNSSGAGYLPLPSIEVINNSNF